MKTYQEVQDDVTDGELFTTEEFIELLNAGEVDEESYGYFHDGDEETGIRVMLDPDELEELKEQYPYIIWYA